MSKFAAGITVPIQQSMTEIERLIDRFGANAYIRYVNKVTGKTSFAFDVRGHGFRIETPIPDRGKLAKEYRGHHTKGQLDKKVEQEKRRLWRVVVQQIKAMLVCAEEGLVTFEQAMMPYHVLPGGKTVQETFGERVEELYQGELLPLLLPAPKQQG